MPQAEGTATPSPQALVWERQCGGAEGITELEIQGQVGGGGQGLVSHKKFNLNKAGTHEWILSKQVCYIIL